MRGIANLPGLTFDHLEVKVAAGRPGLTEVRIRRDDGDTLTGDQLGLVGRQLTDIARVAFGITEAKGPQDGLDDRLWSGLRALSAAPANLGSMPSRPRGGSKEYSDALALVVRDLRHRGERVDTTLAKFLGVSKPRVNQLIREAKDFGSLPEDWRDEPTKAVKLPKRPPATRRARPTRKGSK